MSGEFSPGRRWTSLALYPRNFALAVVLSLAALAFAAPASAQTIDELQRLSIEELGNIEISSVSKTPEPLSDAPAAIYVITHDEIMRSGRTTIPEILRLAPNLEVAQLNATTYAITARGFNVGNNASMSDKLLVLIDGRTVYTPLFAGVYWDMQGVLPENIERIEVISGPGATLWGANAVNGVINIITRNSSDTQGGVLTLGGGNLQRSASLQYGGRLGPNLTYRVHAEGAMFSPTQTSTGIDANDSWSKPQGGFRLDWTPPGDALMLQGDIFEASEAPSGTVGGGDLLAHWQHQLANGSLQLQTYYDRAERFSGNGGGGFSVDTYDLSLQHSFKLGGWNEIVWGAGDRVIDYRIGPTPTLFFAPPSRTLNLFNVFGQDTISLSDKLKLTVGIKLEDEPFSGLQAMPSGRISWKVTDNVLLWSAVSRAVRAPTPVDEDIRELSGTTEILGGSRSFEPEVLTAYEAGTRVQVTPRLSFSFSGFYNVYDDLRSIEISPTTFLPLSWGNLMTGIVYGAEFWGSYRVTDWWRLSAGFNIQHEHFRFKAGSSQIGGTEFTADDPNHQASLRSSINLGHGVTWDTDLRYVGKLHDPAVPDYAELDVRLGWQITPSLDVSISGFNLIHDRHQEFNEPGLSTEIPRSYYVQTRLRF